MRTEHLVLDGGPGDEGRIARAVELLRAGELVAFPTETVYGLGADARNAEALKRLTQAKGRPEGKPYTWLIPSARQGEAAVGGFSRIAQKLARLYWPGALTLVAPRPEGGTLGLRVPDHQVAWRLLKDCGFPLATPSANKSGAPEPVTAADVAKSLDGEIALILDGGPARRGKPSTVVLVQGEALRVLREGVITGAEIIEAARPAVLFVCTGNTCRSPMAAAFMAEAVKGWHGGGQGGETLPFRVLSAGTDTAEDKPPDRMAVAVMRDNGLDISRHRTRGLSPDIVDRADWIFTMTRAHQQSILALMPSAAGRVQLLSGRGEDIVDPKGGSLETYRRARDQIAACLRDVVKLVARSGV